MHPTTTNKSPFAPCLPTTHRAYRANFCIADADGDHVVDVVDLLAVVGAWGVAGGAADLNDDGVVDVNDLLLVVAAWGACP